MKRKQNPSLTTRKNLWHSKTEEKRYSRELRKLIGQYGHRIQEALEHSSHTDSNGKTTLNITTFNQELERIKTELLERDGTDITKEHAKIGMLLGIKYSEKSLKEAGIDDSHS